MNDLITVKVDKARQLLAECRDAADAKKVADIAHAAEVYARRQKLSDEAIGYAHEVKIDALALLGELMENAPKNRGTRGQLKGRDSSGRSQKNPPEEATPTLAEQGIDDKKVAHQARQLRRIKQEGNGLLQSVRKREKTIAQAHREVERERKREDLEKRAKEAEKEVSGECLWELRHGDCVQTLRNLRVRPRLIFADPPYNVGVDYGEGTSADKLPDADYVAWCREWIQASRKLLASDGSFWLLIGDEYAGELAVTVKSVGLTIRSWIKWYETFGVNCSNNFNRCSRHLFYCVANPKLFVFHASAVNRASDRQEKYGDKRADPGGKIWDNVWEIPRLCGTAKERKPDFPTQLPLALLAPIIGCATDPGDLVLDPFAGSATAGEAAVKQGRRFLGIEKQARFVELASLRLQGIRT